MPKKRTIGEIIARAREVHGDRYDYSKAVYRGIHTKMCIICPEHGEFWQEPDNHISRKSGCPLCAIKNRTDKQRKSREAFITEATKVHSGKYDYSKVDYRQTEQKVCIICPEHGEFWQTPHNHLNGAGCPKCTGNYIPTTEEFIEASKARFGDNFDYSKVLYRGNKYKVCIVCPEHGEFWVTPSSHLKQKCGCPKCGGNYGIDREYFIKISNDRFGGKYDYSKVEWKGYKRKVCIVCPEHGDFWQTPFTHLKTQGCQKCSGAYMDRDYFIEKSRQAHNDKYDYSKVEYVNSQTPVCIICPKHGEFIQNPNDHILGHGCRKCYNEETSIRLTKSVDDFLSVAKRVHGDKYDYSQMEYVDRSIPIKIICRKHGAFIQAPKSHIRGAGCPMCNNSVLEDTITTLLKKHDIPFIPQKTFDWLTHNGTLHLDFYLPEHNIVIECQGIQHFQPVEFWGGIDGLEQNKERDLVKKKLCEELGLKVIYYSNLDISYPYPVVEDPGQIIQMIKEGRITDKPFWSPDPELPLSFE